MTLPALELLTTHRYDLTLAAPVWAHDLFAAYSWPVIALTGSRGDRIRALRPFRGSSGLLMTNSFGTALELRLAGVRAVGYARDGRWWLLQRAVAVDCNDHMVEYYWRLALALVSGAPPAPRDFRLSVSEPAQRRARQLLDAHHVDEPYMMLCPVAVGMHRGRDKSWDGFTRLSRDLLNRGIAVVAMPGPRETAAVRTALPDAIVLPESDLATFAAVVAGARGVVANDSGSGHLAAAVGAPLVSVFGVTEPEKTRPWGPRATVVGSGVGWPRYEEVSAAVEAMLVA
ncbi:MAG: glycosyltransferase family 9 protein [Burkholderiaceae bacterium]